MVYRTNNHTVRSSSPGTLLDTVVHFDDTSTSVPLAVCVHGFTNTMRVWDEFAHYMVRTHGYAVACYTLRGHGGSDGLVDLDTRGVQDVEYAVRGVLDLYRTFVRPHGVLLVAYSLGGWFARRAVETSTLFDRLVLVAPLLHVESLRVSDSAAEIQRPLAIRVLGSGLLSAFGQSLMSYSRTGTYVNTTLSTLLRAPLATHPVPVLYIVAGQDRVVCNSDILRDFQQNTHPLSSLVVVPDRAHVRIVGSIEPILTHWLKGDGLSRWTIGETRLVPKQVLTIQTPCTVHLRPWTVPVAVEMPLLEMIGATSSTVLPWALVGAITIHTLHDTEKLLGPVHVACEMLYDPAPVAHVYVYCLLRTRCGSTVVLGHGVLDPKYVGVAAGTWSTQHVDLSMMYPACPAGGVVYITFNRVRFGWHTVYPSALSMQGASEADIQVRNVACTLDIGVTTTGTPNNTTGQ